MSTTSEKTPMGKAAKSAATCDFWNVRPTDADKEVMAKILGEKGVRSAAILRAFRREHYKGYNTKKLRPKAVFGDIADLLS